VQDKNREMSNEMRNIWKRFGIYDLEKMIRIGDVLWVIALFGRSIILAFIGATLAGGFALACAIKERDILSYIGRLLFYPCCLLFYFVVMIKSFF
jgi:hypothetical protein